MLLDTIQAEFKSFREKHAKIKDSLPSGKNLAELQGMSRREKDANQIFDEKCQEYNDQLLDIGEFQLDGLVRNNSEMLKSCQLFENNGNYARDEVEWYRGQMDDIDKLINESKETKKAEIETISNQMEELKQDPTKEFLGEYNNSIQQLSAKEGLGKTFGQPRRLTQERIRAEMTKCEQAQKGVDSLIDKLEDLCEEAVDDNLTINKATLGSKSQQTISIQIRITLVQAIRCIRHYALHLGGFKEETQDLDRISYQESQESIELSEQEQESDAKKAEEELEILGPIGFNNANEPYVKFPEAITQIDQMCKDLCQKLYTGDNLKYLVGNDKIPEYLTIFLEKMKKQAEEFKLSQVRQLRTSAQRLQDLCQEIPKCAYNYIRVRFTALIETKVDTENSRFDKLRVQDKQQKDEHLRSFRPNLENPANKEATQKLNAEEVARSEAYIEVSEKFSLFKRSNCHFIIVD